MITYDIDGLVLRMRPVDDSGSEPVPLPLIEIQEIEIEVYNRFSRLLSKTYKLSLGEITSLGDSFQLVIEPIELTTFMPGDIILRRTFSIINPVFQSGIQNFTTLYLLTYLKKIES